MNRSGLIVYLGGSMTGLSLEECTAWRQAATELLEEAGFTVLDPTRGLTFLRPESVVKDAYEDEFGENKHLVFERDKFDATRADILIINLLKAPRVSIGTMYEVAWGHLAGRFVALAMEREGNPHMHAFVREAASIIMEDIEDLVYYVITTFGQ